MRFEAMEYKTHMVRGFLSIHAQHTSGWSGVSTAGELGPVRKATGTRYRSY